MFADLLAKHWPDFHKEDGKKRVWKRLTAEFKAALPADQAGLVSEDTLSTKLYNERQAIREERLVGLWVGMRKFSKCL